MSAVSARRWIGPAGLALGVLGMGAAAPAAGAPWSGVRPADVMDPLYQMKAFTVGVPDGWRFAGQVVRDGSCHGAGPGLKTIVVGPDGLTAIGYFPGYGWSTSSDPMMRQIMARTQCPAVDLQTASDFVVNTVLPKVHPGASVVWAQPLGAEGQAAMATQLAQMRQSFAAGPTLPGMKPPQVNMDGARVRVRYQDQGRPMEEQWWTAVTCIESSRPGFGVQAPSSQRNCFSGGATFIRAPLGQLDALINAPEAMALTKMTQADPAWSKRVADAQARQMQQLQAQGDANIAAIRQRGQEQTAAIVQQGEAFRNQMRGQFERSQAQDRATVAAMQDSAHRTVLSVLDRKEFVNPANGQIVQGSANYNHQWISSDGRTMIQNNDHQFDPNGVVNPVTQSWTPLVPR